MVEVPPDLDLEQAIQYILGFKKVAKYPRKLQALKVIEVPSTVKEIYKLADTLEEYANDLNNYGSWYEEALTLDKSYIQGNADIDCQVEKLIWDRSGLAELGIPVEQKQKIWNKAWVNCHAHGYYSAFCELCDLVELFK